MVFSSIGDTTRVSPLQNRARSGLLATHSLLPSAVSGAGTLARSFFTIVFPADCPLCASPLNNISRLPVCEACIAAMGQICGPTCDACGEGVSLSNPWEKLTLCGACQEQLPPYRNAVAYGSYDAELRELIHVLKYDQVHPVASVLGTMLAIAISKLELSGQVLVLPVPLRSSKRRLRGFNQAELIAHSALKAMDRKRFQLATNLMERVGPRLSRTDPAAASGQPAGRLRGSASKQSKGWKHPAGRRRFDDRHNRRRVRASFAQGGREERLGSNGRKDLEEFCRERLAGEIDMQVAVND